MDSPLKTKKSVRTIISEDEDEESIELNVEPMKSTDESLSQPKNDAVIKPMVFNSDLFDAELDSDDEAPTKTTTKGSAVSDEEFGGAASGEESEPEISNELKKKLGKLKGAAKKPVKKAANSGHVAGGKAGERPGRKSKPTKEQMSQMHAETQRMVRDASLKLPYHQPKSVSLAEMQARIAQKKMEFGNMTSVAKWKDSKAVLMVESKLAKEHRRSFNHQEVLRAEKKRKEQRAEEEKKLKEEAEQKKKRDDEQKKQQDLPMEGVTDHLERLNSSQVGNDVNMEDVDRTQNKSPEAAKCDIEDVALKIASFLEEPSSVPPLESSVATETSPIGLLSDPLDADVKIPTKKRLEEDSCQSDAPKVDNAGDDEDFDDLPELMIELDSDDEHDNVGNSEAVTSTVTEDPSSMDLILANVEADLRMCKSTVTSLESKACGIPVEQDSGIVTTPSDSDEEKMLPSSPQIARQPNTSRDVTGGEQKMEVVESQIVAPTNSLSNTVDDVSSKDAATTPKADSKRAKRKSGVTPLLSRLNLKLRTLTPSIGSAAKDGVIELDDEVVSDVTEDKAKSGHAELLERLAKHHIVKKKKPTDVEVSCVVKQKNEETNKEELKLEKFKIKIDKNDKNIGACRLALKEQLSEGMRIEREKARALRVEAFALDNEDGYEDAPENDILDDDGDFTGSESSSGESEPEEDIVDDDYGKDEAPREHCEYAVDEAEETDPGDDEDDDLEADIVSQETNDGENVENESRGDDHQLLRQETETLNLQMDESNDGAGEIGGREATLVSPETVELFTDDAISEAPQLSQRSNSDKIEVSDRPFESFSQKQDDVTTANTNSPLPNCALRGEDISVIRADATPTLERDYSFGNDSSFDMSQLPMAQRTLRKMSPQKDKDTSTIGDASSHLADDVSSQLGGSQAESTPRPVTFDLERSESCLLDENGLLKPEKVVQPARRQLLLDNSASMGQNLDVSGELLGLCSESSSSKASSGRRAFGGVLQLVNSNGDNTQSNMDELMGKFPTQAGSHPVDESSRAPSEAAPSVVGRTQKRRRKRKAVIDSDDEDGDAQIELVVTDDVTQGKDDEESNLLFNDVESVKEMGARRKLSRIRRVANDDDESSDEEDAVSVGDLEDDKENQETSDFFVDKRGMMRKEFVEGEAELSGSEVESDEDFDLDERHDIMEAEEGDKEKFDQLQLQDEVGRVHLKTMIDQDKRDIRLYQEILLPDGDLYSEGQGRMRRFRWQNIDEDMDGDLGNDSDDDGKGTEETEDEQKWRLERMEREKFIMEQKAKEMRGESDDLLSGLDADNPLVKLAMKTQTSSCSKAVTPPVAKAACENGSATAFKKPLLKAHGSLLNAGQQELSRIAELTKGTLASASGPRHSKNFVFTSVSEDASGGRKTTSSAAKQSKKSTSSQPTKRPRLEQSSSLPSNSVFNLLD